MKSISNYYIPEGKKAKLEQVAQINTLIGSYIRERSKRNDQSNSIFLETDFVKLYELAFENSFEHLDRNKPAIDLISTDGSVALQVSSDNSLKKIKECFVKFYSKDEYDSIAKIKFFFLSTQKIKIDQSFIDKIENHLNSSKIKKAINCKRSIEIDEIEIKRSRFDPKYDIKYLSFLEDDSFKYSNDQIDGVLKILTGFLPIFKTRVEDVESYYWNTMSKSLNLELAQLSGSEYFMMLRRRLMPLHIIPRNILCGLKYGKERIGYYIENGVLLSDNVQLIDDLKEEISQQNNFSISSFFRINKITQIKGLKNIDKVDIIYDSSVKVTCKICNYEAFKIDKQHVFNSDEPTSIEDSASEHNFTKAFLLANFGRFDEAGNLFIKILNDTNKSFGVALFLCKYNLQRLNEFRSYKGDRAKAKDRLILEQIQNDISKVFIDNITIEENDIIEYIYRFDHVKLHYKMVELLIHNSKCIQINQKGRKYSKNIIKEWQLYIIEIYNFTNHNKLLYDLNYSNFGNAVELAIKYIIDISRSNWYIYKNVIFYDRFVQICLLYCSENDFKDIFRAHFNNNLIFTVETNLKIFSNRIHIQSNNLLEELDLLKIWFSDQKLRCDFKDRVGTFISNACTYLTYGDIKTTDLNIIIKKILLIAETKVIFPIHFSYVISLFNIKQDVIDINNFKQFKSLLKLYPITIQEIEIFNKIFEIKPKRKYEYLTCDELINLYINDSKNINLDIFKENVFTQLTKEFGVNNFRLFVIFNLVDYYKFENVYIEKIKEIIEDQHAFFFNEITYGGLFEMAFHLNIDLKQEKYQVLKPSFLEDQDKFQYFNWLFDIENFDYTKFNPFWLLKYQSDIYFIHFSKSGVIRTYLKNHLKVSGDKYLCELYFRYFDK